MTAFHKRTINQTSCQILGVLSSKHSSYFVAKYLCRLFNACFCMFLECSKLLETPTGHSETIHGHSRSYCRKPLADRLAPRVPATAQHVKATWLGHVNTIPVGEKHEKNIKTKQTKKRCPASFLSANASFWYRDWKSLPFLSNLLHGHEFNSLNTTTPTFFSFSIQLTYSNKTQPHKTKYEQHLLDCLNIMN